MEYTGSDVLRDLQNYLWAKTNPYKQLLCHMIDAGCCAAVYLNSSAASALRNYLCAQWNYTKEQTSSFVSYLVAMHDIGKASPQFQMQNEEQLDRLKKTGINDILPIIRPEPVRHEYLSRKIARRIWKKDNPERINDAYSCVLSLHHQRIDQSVKRKQTVYEVWNQIQDNLETTLRSLFGFDGKLPIPKQLDPVCMLLTGILILSDWVASSGAFAVMSEITDRYLDMSMAIADRTMKQYGLIEDHRITGTDSFRTLWPQIVIPRDIQTKCDKIDALAPLTIIEAPMGEGKTEAALYCAVRAAQAQGKRGIYVGLPTQATSNQMYGRFAEMLQAAGGGHARLLHGMAFLMRNESAAIQSEDSEEAGKWLNTARMGLLDENGVGTIDQAMGSVLLARFSVLRLLGLANKVLIIDELHAYDAYMSEIIESLLRWCRSLQIPVILLSATLQQSQRIRYIPKVG